jgi:phosphoglycerol transferase MdoB-like AlkP superfamily enzyme
VSELLSIALFLASVVIYAWKAGRNTWWFAATLTVLGLFVVLNITLYASDYFTGDGINDAVLYTLTNSLTGAGIGKYILPGVGWSSRWLPYLARSAGCCAAVGIILITSVTAWRRCCWRWPPWMPARPSIRSASW